MKTAGHANGPVKHETTLNTLAGAEGIYVVDVTASNIEWDIDRSQGEGHMGTIGLSEGTVEVKEGVIANGNFLIDMKTIKNTDIADTGKNAGFVAHMMNEEFFVVDSFPTAHLVIKKSVYMPDANNFWITADLTIKGITKSIDFPAVVTVNDKNLDATGSFVIDRSRWGVTYGSPTVEKDLSQEYIRDEIAIKVSLKAKKP